MNLKLSQARINYLGAHSSVYDICVNGKIKYIHELMGKEVVVCGTVGAGDAKNYEQIECYEVVELDKYNGHLAPLPYGPHFDQVSEGHRERSYEGMTATFKKTTYVFVGKRMTFTVSNAAHRRSTARRLYKKWPLIAYAEMVEMEGKTYSMADFIKDITIKQTSAKRKKKNTLVRYGRYWEIERLLSEYNQTKNMDALMAAQRLRSHIKDIYRVVVKIGKETKIYTYPATASYNSVKSFTEAVTSCKSFQEVEALEEKMMEWSHVG